MADPKERLVSLIFIAELERRWSTIQEMMRERKINGELYS